MTSRRGSIGGEHRTAWLGTRIALLASMAAACGSNTTEPPTKDSAVDPPSDLNLDLKKDTEQPGCQANGRVYNVGASVPMPGECVTCKCQPNGSLGQCTGGCVPDAANDSPPDSPMGCTRNGKSYSPGEVVPIGDRCGGSCVCLASGAIGQCSGACVDASLDLSPDGKLDQAPETGPETPPSDPACLVGQSCSLAGGGNGLCAAGVCKACAGKQEDASCAAVYGAGTICVSGQCVTGTCHNSTECTGNRVCDGTHTCKACTVDTQCQNDPDAYGRNTLCLAGQCVPGECRDSVGCQGNKVCNSSSHMCTPCATDQQCKADPRYGASHLCIAGQCLVGTCHNSTECTGNRVCDGTHACNACSTDAQCQNDPDVYGRQTICHTGQCLVGECHTSADCTSNRLCNATTRMCGVCANDLQCQADSRYGAASICLAGQCVAGTCATSANCRDSGRICPASRVCAACTTDAQCKADPAYGANTICSSGQCVSGACTTSAGCPSGRMCNSQQRVCVACTTDTECKADARYGAYTICLAGMCTLGDCHDTSADCSSGRICGSSVPHACGDCTTDAQCRQDPRYQNGTICVGNLCVKGDCHDTSNECTAAKAGLVCGAKSPHQCGACSSDDQCTGDPKYGANSMCVTTPDLATTGQCASNACSNTGHACSNNANDVCCGAKCIPGNCCADADCRANPVYGDSYFCRQNTCTRCDGVTGNNYVVDPVAGNDTTATGSGTVGGKANAACSFRTLRRALEVLGSAPPANTTITLLGRAGATTSFYTSPASGDPAPVDVPPFTVPANVTITTKTGPLKLTLANNKVGFILNGNLARLLPAAAAPLTIDGGNHVSAAGVVASAGSVSLANVTITNTGEDGIQVTAGTAQIGPGVRVSGAGTAAAKQSGLLVSGPGTVVITVAANEAQTAFENNSDSGISVTGAGVLNVNGASVTNGVRTVAAQNNVGSNVSFLQVPADATAVSTIDGLYAFASRQGDGLTINAGSKLKLRNSVLLANSGSGIRIVGTASSNALAPIDLGSAASTPGNAGKNVLQAIAGANPNIGAGLCIQLGANPGAQTLRAAGNRFAGRDCSVANPAPDPIRQSASCTGATDLGGAGTSVTVTTDHCGKQAL